MEVPLLSHILETSRSLLTSSHSAASVNPADIERGTAAKSMDLRVGFVGSVTSMSLYVSGLARKLSYWAV